jgi:hypothetical protein
MIDHVESPADTQTTQCVKADGLVLKSVNRFKNNVYTVNGITLRQPRYM